MFSTNILIAMTLANASSFNLATVIAWVSFAVLAYVVKHLWAFVLFCSAGALNFFSYKVTHSLIDALGEDSPSSLKLNVFVKVVDSIATFALFLGLSQLALTIL